jgi:hypothetical protein
MDPRHAEARRELPGAVRIHAVTLNALLEAAVELRRANTALTAENARLRMRNSLSMFEQVRRTPRGRPPPSARP